MVDPSCRARAHADVANGRFAQRADLELQAVGRGPRTGASAARPIRLREPERRVVTSGLVVEPDVAGRRAVNRVTDVVDRPTIAVVPGTWYVQGSCVVGEERSTQLAAGF